MNRQTPPSLEQTTHDPRSGRRLAVAPARLVDASEIAARLGVPKSWVLESARSGAMPCVRLGRYVRFDDADVDAWIEKCKQPGRPIALRRYEPKARA